MENNRRRGKVPQEGGGEGKGGGGVRGETWGRVWGGDGQNNETITSVFYFYILYFSIVWKMSF